ncbi:MAG: hypothetical protein ACE5JG_04380, partial [Planctomycetota bacterium]
TLLLLPAGLLLAACSTSSRAPPAGRSTAAKTPPTKTKADPIVRVVWRQFHKNSPTLVIENMAGRERVDLSSRALKPGEPIPAYVEDRIMRELLKVLRKEGFHEYARAPLPDPAAKGVRSEILLVTGAQTRSLTFGRGTPKKQQFAYRDCRDAVFLVYNNTPKFQFTRQGRSALKIDRVEVPKRR